MLSVTAAMLKAGILVGPNTEFTIGVHEKCTLELEAAINALFSGAVVLGLSSIKCTETGVLTGKWHCRMNRRVPGSSYHSAKAELSIVTGKKSSSGFWAPCRPVMAMRDPNGKGLLAPNDARMLFHWPAMVSDSCKTANSSPGRVPPRSTLFSSGVESRAALAPGSAGSSTITCTTCGSWGKIGFTSVKANCRTKSLMTICAVVIRSVPVCCVHTAFKISISVSTCIVFVSAVPDPVRPTISIVEFRENAKLQLKATVMVLSAACTSDDSKANPPAFTFGAVLETRSGNHDVRGPMTYVPPSSTKRG